MQKRNTIETKIINRLLLFMIILIVLLSTGCIENDHDHDHNRISTSSEDVKTSTSKKYDYHFKVYQIENYEKLRVYDFFKKNGFTKYTQVGTKVNYHYTSEDYKRASELDDTYLYGMYLYTSQETFDEILKALEYSCFDDFLIKNGYIDENGQPEADYTRWRYDSLKEIDKIMKKNANIK